MKPGTRVVSNTFDMGDWEADQTVQAPERLPFLLPRASSGSCRRRWTALGGWASSELTLEQKYQTFTGKVATGNVIAPI